MQEGWKVYSGTCAIMDSVKTKRWSIFHYLQPPLSENQPNPPLLFTYAMKKHKKNTEGNEVIDTA